MIKENQRLLNRVNVLLEAAILYACFPLAFMLRFYAFSGGVISVGLDKYLLLGIAAALLQLLLYALFGLYASQRRASGLKELALLWLAGGIVMAALLSLLFVAHGQHFSRLTLAIYFVLSGGLLSCKRICTRLVLRRMRKRGYNLKHILLVGSGKMAAEYLSAVRGRPELGYSVSGYISENDGALDAPHLGGYEHLQQLLEALQPDEIVCAMDACDEGRMPQVIAACERAGKKLSIIPFYAQYMSGSVQMEEIGGVPLLNIRRVPLENWGNAFIKRAVDIVGSALLILLTSPVMLVCAIGVKLSSPGPVIFRQERVGRGGRNFYMYKFRSMRVNDSENTGWSRDRDERKTKFGAVLRKYSLDEFPQFFNVLRGDMSLVGPRPELPHFVERFKDEIPLYMVKHQVRPGITGWAQIHGLRGDTSIAKRIEHDIHYIEHWTLLLDIKILLVTVFGGKFKNSEKLM